MSSYFVQVHHASHDDGRLNPAVGTHVMAERPQLRSRVAPTFSFLETGGNWPCGEIRRACPIQ